MNILSTPKSSSTNLNKDDRNSKWQKYRYVFLQIPKELLKFIFIKLS